MMSVAGAVGPQLLQEGCRSQLPPCSLTDADLSTHPGLESLLTALCKHMDASGLSVSLAHQMEEAKKELQLRRANWLKWEALHRILQEALRELVTGHTPQDRKFLEVLERQLLVGELKRMLALDSSVQGVQPSILGLKSSDVLELLPSKQEVERMQKQLPLELEKRLKSKCLALLSYYQPETDGAGQIVRSSMLETLAETFSSEKRRLQEAHARHQELVGLLEQQKTAYPEALLRCLSILKRLAREYRLGAQSELDHLNTQYLEIKCHAMFLKIRLEELNILLETYPPEKVGVHRMIRDSLQAALSHEEQGLANSNKLLSNYEILGPEFEELVKEYAQLQAVIENRRWVLREFNKD